MEVVEDEHVHCGVCYQRLKHMKCKLYYVPHIWVNVCKDCLVFVKEAIDTVLDEGV